MLLLVLFRFKLLWRKDTLLKECCVIIFGSYVIQYCINQAFSVFNILNTAILILQVLSKDDPSRKTYVYKLNVPVAAQWISLAVAPFEILPDHQFNLISHMCLPAKMLKLRNTVEFFHNAFRFFILVM